MLYTFPWRRYIYFSREWRSKICKFSPGNVKIQTGISSLEKMVGGLLFAQTLQNSLYFSNPVKSILERKRFKCCIHFRGGAIFIFQENDVPKFASFHQEMWKFKLAYLPWKKWWEVSYSLKLYRIHSTFQIRWNQF